MGKRRKKRQSMEVVKPLPSISLSHRGKKGGKKKRK